ncbi:MULTISPECIES: Do family serine endopeptidase [Rhodanobacter]|uniref:Do family serine endopeptidase n=1 Tax=Rhodanobacter TaxID=75309 RepID=UPI000424537A|nr:MULTISPECIES: Do family serine endopeptidase [Rhodanobacter]KZC19724.1 protease Do [Rhodanobacter denitrificans]UJJ49536.1 Do family serine endopeptidase [Rhodanobacter denitrificans]UJM92250.1 Do family serine endopeptidase [Rhodanobacter denitrificans]UJM95779.1 Do family serine endopeptidase [Rhodanobacter denitrificans]UJN21390.1 Do family serine endopeptidase [Rhodanobacter denitrificans]
MNHSILRSLACCALLGIAAAGTVQAQAPAAAALPDFTGIVQKNAPAVVHVEARYNGERQGSSRSIGGQMMPGQGMPDDPQAEILRRFFGMPMMPSPQEQRHTSLGSGFIISGDGYILTNNHVVDHADKVTVRLQDRRTLTARVIGTDPTYDIALLKVDAGGSLPAVTLGDSRSLKPGQWVLAIGSPFGFDYTVTQGIVSAVGRNLGQRDQPYTSFIQTDVPINRGNSGGPLFDLQGRVVGINSQIYSNTGTYSGVAFSIPIDVAMNAVQQLKSKGYVSRGMLGVTVQPVDDDMVKAFGLDNGVGAAVVDVTANSGAARAGIQSGDVILAYDGRTLQQASDLPPLVGMTKPGSKVPVEILRNGRKQTLQVTISEAARDRNAVNGQGTAPSLAHSGSAALGLTVQSIDDGTRTQLGLKPGQGVVIGDIAGPVAAQAGLRAGDVILMVNQQKIGSVAEFEAATKGVKAGSTVLLLVRRGEQSNFVGLTVPDDK